MTIEQASIKDADRLAILHSRCFDDPWNGRAIADLLAQPPVFALASTEGFILARAAGGEAEILTIAVLPEVRRQGLGARLVKAAAEHACRMRADTMFLEVGAGNDAARALYESLGFCKVGLRNAYYPDGGDALVLKASLPLSVLGKTG